MSWRRRGNDDRGESLIELILAIGILGICVLAIGSSIALSVKTSAIHRGQATADAFLHNYAETLQSSYTPCANGASYTSGLPLPSGNFQTGATVQFWNATTASFGPLPSCTSSTDPGLQQVTLTLGTTDGTVSESLVVILRNAT
ncbi:MAG: type II secretion system protein [Jatrophihabitantaceae bacterium]